MNQETITKYIKNGFHIHLIHAFLQHITKNTYLSATLSIKLYSLNYFYWYGTLYNYLPNPHHNWVKQFIRFTDTGHIASALPLIMPSALPVAHNVHFIIMSGYWLGRLAFGLKDADRIAEDGNNGLIDWHTDLCTFIHHTVPYILIHTLWPGHRDIMCSYEYRYETLLWTYAFLKSPYDLDRHNVLYGAWWPYLFYLGGVTFIDSFMNRNNYIYGNMIAYVSLT